MIKTLQAVNRYLMPSEVSLDESGIIFQVFYPDGDEFWYLNGKRHRGDGKPAAFYFDGRRVEYYINGKQVTKKAAQVYALLFKEKEEEEEEKEWK